MTKQTIVSPLPGVFYHRPSPDQAAFKTIGDQVSEGDTVGLVEVMKSFHEIKSTTAGVFAGYRVDNEGTVQAGQALAEVSDQDQNE